MLGFLDYQRATFEMKIDGLDQDQMAQTTAKSSMTLAGLAKHLALVEDHWFQARFLDRPMPEPWASAPFDDDPDWEFHSAVTDDPDELRAQYVAACERSRDAIAGASMSDESAQEIRGFDGTVSLEWIVLHMIEETARHNGHADLLREAIDGSVGE